MGVKKLSRFVRSTLGAQFPGACLEAGDVLLVDASGFAFWVQETGGLASHEAAADFWAASGAAA